MKTIRQLAAIVTLYSTLWATMWAQTTPSLQLNIPPTGQQNWGVLVNANFTRLDTLLACYGTATTPGTVVQWNGSAWVCSTVTAGLQDPGSNGIIKRIALNTTAPANFHDFFNLFTGCSGSQYPGFDGACHTAGTGVADPGGNGIMKRTALNVTAPAVYTDVFALFSGCSGSQYPGFDGNCHTAGSGVGDPGANGIMKRTALNTTAPAVFGDVFNLFTGCSGTQVPGFDGTCHTLPTQGLGDPGGSGIVTRTSLNATSPAVFGDVFALFSSCSGIQYPGFDGQCHNPGTGLGDPGGNGLVTRTALNTTAPAVFGDVFNLFSGCSGSQVPGFDGMCHALPTQGLGDPGGNGIVLSRAID